MSLRGDFHTSDMLMFYEFIVYLRCHYFNFCGYLWLFIAELRSK